MPFTLDLLNSAKGMRPSPRPDLLVPGQLGRCVKHTHTHTHTQDRHATHTHTHTMHKYRVRAAGPGRGALRMRGHTHTDTHTRWPSFITPSHACSVLLYACRHADGAAAGATAGSAAGPSSTAQQNPTHATHPDTHTSRSGGVRGASECGLGGEMPDPLATPNSSMALNGFMAFSPRWAHLSVCVCVCVCVCVFACVTFNSLTAFVAFSLM